MSDKIILLFIHIPSTTENVRRSAELHHVFV